MNLPLRWASWASTYDVSLVADHWAWPYSPRFHRSAHRISRNRAGERIFNLIAANRHDTAKTYLLRVDLSGKISAVDLALVNARYRALLLLQQKPLSTFAAKVLHLYVPDPGHVRGAPCGISGAENIGGWESVAKRASATIWASPGIIM